MSTSSFSGAAMTFNADEAIEMERRHIREGEARVTRQEEIVNRLNLRCAFEAVLRARELLAQHHRFVEDAKERLADLQRRYPAKPSGAN